MSAPIRPPGSPPPGLTGPGSLGEAAPGASAVQSGRPAQVAPGAASAGAAEAQAAAPSPSTEWLRRLDAGEISRQQAIEELVAQALEAQGAARLSAAQRSELADVLRQTLLGDPVLGALLGE
jgi:hypothetical protein